MRHRYILFVAMALSLFSWRAVAANTQTISAAALANLQHHVPLNLIVEYDASAIEREVATLRLFRGDLDRDDAFISNYRSNHYATLKNDVDTAIAHPDIDPLMDYSHLPMSYKRFRSLGGLQALLADSRVVAVYEDKLLHHADATSFPFINQPAVSTVGYNGAGTTVAVIDDGIDYTLADFGYCTAPGAPSSCHVVVSQLFGSGTTDTSHGSNVSAIVLGVAPATQIAMLNVFSGTSAASSNIISAINWTISNHATYNIVAINMSLGDSSKNTTTCKSGNAFYTPITNARSAGINVVVAAGNDAYTNALANPACTPGAVSVGAVYDANYGGLSWGSGLCTDSTTAADQVTCFSDSASFLTMLAPGALITAAGFTEGGTSQAAPHVTGSIAVLRSAFPSETLTQIESRLTHSDVMDTDSRNGLVKPRLDLLTAARPANDAFANRTTISGNSGAITATNLLASKEINEPNHAGNSGGHSVWWKWVAPASGQISLDTHGSNFDTLLATYTGTTLATLQAIASNDNDGSANSTSGLLFEAQSGVEYEIAVDGANGASDSIKLNWSLNTNAQANLSASISGPTGAQSGADSNFTVTVSNAGPQSATNATATIPLPTGAAFVSGPSNCTTNGSTIVCSFGTIANGGTANAAIIINWNGSGTFSIPVSVTSDVPDPTSSNNSTSIQIQVINTNSVDTPMLPNWAITAFGLMLASLLLFRQPVKALQ